MSERDASDGGGGSDSGGAGGGDRHSLSLRYDAPALGAIDLRFELDPASLQVSATVGAGSRSTSPSTTPASSVTRSPSAIGRPVTVDVSPRREPLDLYA